MSEEDFFPPQSRCTMSVLTNIVQKSNDLSQLPLFPALCGFLFLEKPALLEFHISVTQLMENSTTCRSGNRMMWGLIVARITWCYCQFFITTITKLQFFRIKFMNLIHNHVPNDLILILRIRLFYY